MFLNVLIDWINEVTGGPRAMQKLTGHQVEK